METRLANAGEAMDATGAGVLPDAIRIRSLSKLYRHPWTGSVTVGIEDLSLDVRPGEVFGLLGPNGAGKTTTLKLLTGLIRPTRGEAWIFGASFRDPSSRRTLGFLPEQPYFFDSLNGIEYLELVGRLSGLTPADSRSRARHWLERVGLGGSARLRLRKYSKGMLQRLGLAAAVLHEPALLILDEPMSGLDPFGRRDVRELIVEQRERGVTVLFSSHILPDVEMLCDRVGIIHRGRLTRVATVGELVSHGRDQVEIRCGEAPVLELPPAWRDLVTRREHPEGSAFLLADGTRVNEVVGWLIAQGVKLRAVTPQRGGLEEVFLEAAQAAEPARRVGAE